MDPLAITVIVTVGLGILILFFAIFKTPIKWAFKLLINSAVGFVALFVLNFFGGFVGISLGLNWLNAVIVGLLGVPGIILLLLVKYLF